MASASTVEADVQTDPLQVALRLLERVDRETARAIETLGEAVMVTIPKPHLVLCEFKEDGVLYSRELMAAHRDKILAAVKANDDVRKTVENLLGDMNEHVEHAVRTLASVPGVIAGSGQPSDGVTTLALIKIVLGCCVHSGGATPNLTQTQCLQYNPTQWDKDNPTCLGPRGGNLISERDPQ